MPERYGMFDSTPEDAREYSMEDFSRFFTMFLTSGIFNGGTNLKVFCDGTNINTKINLGRGWIQGYAYEIYDSPVVLQHELPSPTLDRIDRIVLRLDKTLEHRYLKAFVKKGTDAEKPVPPSLTRNDNLWEISLAQVQIIKGKSYIEPWQITDERLDNSVCGLVNSLIQADTKTIFDQFQYWYNAKTKEYDENWNVWTSQKTKEFNTWTNAKKIEYENKTTEFINVWNNWFNTKTTEFIKMWNDWYGNTTPALEKQFTDWFKDIKAQLDGDVAGQLLNQINEVKVKIENVNNNVGDKKDLKTTNKDSIVNAINEVFQSANNSLQQVNKGKEQIKNAVVGKDSSVSFSENPTFEDLSSAISKISMQKLSNELIMSIKNNAKNVISPNDVMSYVFKSGNVIIRHSSFGQGGQSSLKFYDKLGNFLYEINLGTDSINFHSTDENLILVFSGNSDGSKFYLLDMLGNILKTSYLSDRVYTTFSKNCIFIAYGTGEVNIFDKNLNLLFQINNMVVNSYYRLNSNKNCTTAMLYNGSGTIHVIDENGTVVSFNAHSPLLDSFI